MLSEMRNSVLFRFSFRIFRFLFRPNFRIFRSVFRFLFRFSFFPFLFRLFSRIEFGHITWATGAGCGFLSDCNVIGESLFGADKSKLRKHRKNPKRRKVENWILENRVCALQKLVCLQFLRGSAILPSFGPFCALFCSRSFALICVFLRKTAFRICT